MRILIAAAILVSAPCLNAAASSPDDELMAEIAFAFKLRQSKSRSFIVEWTEERT